MPPCPVECPVLQIGRDRQIGMGPSRGGIGGGILINTLEALRLKLLPLKKLHNLTPRIALTVPPDISDLETLQVSLMRSH